MEAKRNKVNEVILHVGLHKTGSSSIQETLFSQLNNKLLDKKGYLYPKGLNANHSIPIYSAFCEFPEKYHINVMLGYNKAEIININTMYLQGLEREIEESEKAKLIISGEDISLLPIESLYRFKKYLESLSLNPVSIKVILYVRNPLPWSISAIQEKIKGGEPYKNALEQMKTAVETLFKPILNKFVLVFGKERVNVYTFEKAVEHRYGIVGHFLSLLGFNENEINKFILIRVNKSISQISGELLAFINEKIPLIIDNNLNEKRTNGDIISLLDIRGSKFDIPYSDKKDLLEKAQDDITWLKETYGIDYSIFKEQEECHINNEFTDEICEDIRKAFFSPQLSLDMRKLIIDYLKENLENYSNYHSKLQLRSLLDDLT